MPPPAYLSTVELEAALGDPFDPTSSLSLRQIMAWDEREEDPADGMARLRELGLHSFFVPQAAGGRLRSFEESVSLLRAVSRRDTAMAMGFHSSLVGSTPVWLWGTADQRRAVADALAEGELGAFAFNEERAGNDVQATETEAVADGDRFLLNGEKWLVDNATRCGFLTVLARCGADLSFFLVRKRDLAADSFRHLPRISTVGLRGHDLSGIAFEGCGIGGQALIGEAGRGVEMMLRTAQIAKTMTAAMALGQVDSALRVAFHYARDRRLYGRPLTQLPPTKELLVGAFVDALGCDCVATATARALTAAPERVSLWSAVTRYHVQMTCERIVRDLSAVLGERAYLREKVAHGLFQKIARDLAITSMFEGTTLLQLTLVGAQLDAVTRAASGRQGRELAGGHDLRDLFDLGRPAPAWDIDDPRLQVSNAGQDEIVQRFERSARAFQRAYRSVGGDLDALEAIAWSLDRLVEQYRLLVDKVSSRPRGSVGRSPGLASVHCTLHAAAACFHTWLYNRELVGGEFADGRWLALCLGRQLRELAGPPPVEPPAAFIDGVFAWMQRLHEEGLMFSVVGVPVASSADSPEPGVV
jgi:alkylation response protein AidB-like acyl-CoA dehydrogenase